MAKRTAIIDIGSNSARLVIFEKTSSFGFHLICEQKSKVRIGEGAYEKGGYLQPKAITRTFFTLQSFTHTIKKYQAKKTLCVATSALRDAPNRDEFLNMIQNELHLSIKIIDGHKEAMYGALAAKNLLPIEDGISVDIGGGSSDIALIKKGQIVATHTLNLGTVRLKELFFDNSTEKNSQDIRAAKKYILNALKTLPATFRHNTVIGIGGTARTLSRGVMKRSAYPLDKLHAFQYNVEENVEYFRAITEASNKSFKSLFIKKNRYDTVREGTLIFIELLSYIGAKEVITSGVGVREGVYLEYILKHKNFTYPKGVNPSITAILDRFKPYVTTEKRSKHGLDMASSIYKVLQEIINDDLTFNYELRSALKLSNIGNTLSIYKSHQTAFFIAKHELNYGFTHQEMILISMLLRMHGKSLINEELYEEYKSLLPKRENLVWLSFIYSLTLYIIEASHSAKVKFTYENNKLTINSSKPLYLAKENIDSLEKPKELEIIIDDRAKLPKNNKLGI